MILSVLVGAAGQETILDGEDVSGLIRTQEISSASGENLTALLLEAQEISDKLKKLK